MKLNLILIDPVFDWKIWKSVPLLELLILLEDLRIFIVYGSPDDVFAGLSSLLTDIPSWIFGSDVALALKVNELDAFDVGSSEKILAEKVEVLKLFRAPAI